MNKLIAELSRLYFLSADSAEAERLPDDLLAALEGEGDFSISLSGDDNTVRLMLLHFPYAADWPAIRDCFQHLVQDMELPPPAISVSGEQGYTMWFSLSQPVPLEQAEAFLSGVRAQFLAELPAHHVLSCPSPEGALTAPLTPALHAVSGRWSVYIDPRLGGMFVEQCGLEIPPNMDHQAELLSGLKSIESNDFQRVLRSLGAHEAARAPRSNSPAVTGNKNAADPHAFLQDVMNDPAVPLKLRIKAAKALLPYVNR